jgi:hypothetical protein
VNFIMCVLPQKAQTVAYVLDERTMNVHYAKQPWARGKA